MSIIELESYEEVSRDKAWQQAMETDMKMIEKNETWQLVERPMEKPVIGVKLVYKTKLNLDWSGSQDDMKNTSGYAFSFGSGVFSWASIKQHSVALSTAEVEYVSASEATTQAIWLRFVLEDFGAEATSLMVDNTSAIAITKKSSVSPRD